MENIFTQLPEIFSTTLWTILKIMAIVIPLMISVAYLTYFERRVIGFMQGRLGPNRVGYFGLLQPIADALKLMFKEIIHPTKSNNFSFDILPVGNISSNTILNESDTLDLPPMWPLANGKNPAEYTLRTCV